MPVSVELVNPNFRLPLPPLREQQAIACILGALDAKIELNRELCLTWEVANRLEHDSNLRKRGRSTDTARPGRHSTIPLAEYERDEKPFAKLPQATARMLRDDLDEARRRWLDEAETDAQRAEREQSDFLRHTDAAGRVADFHGLRHAYISAIVAGGASIRTAQELARHSTPVLTIGRYSHARLHDIQGALEALPDLQSHESVKENQATAATGTDGPVSNGSRYGSRRDAKPCLQVAKPREGHESCREESGFPQTVSITGFNGNPRESARSDEREAPGGFEPPMADLQSDSKGPKPQGKTAFSVMRGQMRGHLKPTRNTSARTCRR